MTSLAVRADGPEQMDAADLDPATLAHVLRDLARVNRVTLARRPTLAFLRRALGTATHFRLLDVGFGGGDMLRGIARWAARHGIAAELTGIDLNPHAAPAARAATPPSLPITFLTGDHGALEGPFDFVVSSLVAHHMDAAEIVAFLRFMEGRARRGWLVNDLHRRPLAHAGFPLLARAMGWHRIVREDGTLSIARSFRAADWRQLLAAAGISGAAIVPRFPFRLCVERIR